MSYENICYTAPFLKEAVIRIDFPAPLSCFSEPLHDKIRKAALSKFSIPEQQKLVSQELQFSGENFSTNSREVTQWTFHGKDRDKSLIITPETIIQTTKSYKSYEVFSGDFFCILDALKAVQPEHLANRIGIRYVNILDLSNGDPLEWKDYVHESMLGIIEFSRNRKNVSRAFHILEYNFDPINLKFQFGIANPDYPAIVKRKQFVLDLDAYSYGTFDLSYITSIIENSHNLIQEFFELSITDKTRKMMKQKKVMEKK